MGAAKRIMRRLADTTVRLDVGSVDTITGRLPVLALFPDGEPSVMTDLAHALGLADAESFHPDEPPVFARTVKPRFVVAPGEEDELSLLHEKRGALLSWEVDTRTLLEVTQGGQALLVLATSAPTGARTAAEHLVRVPVHSGWIDVLREPSEPSG